MTPQTQAVVKTEEKPMEYVPFGGKDPIKLSIQNVQNLIAVKTRSGKTCSVNDAIKFMMMCKARLLNPYEGDAFLIGYDGKDGPTFSLITAHQAFLKRAELHPEYDGMKSGVILQGKEDKKLSEIEGDFYQPDSETVVGGWATVFFKNRKYPMSKKIRLARFQKQFGVWQDDPAGMVCKCFDEETEVLTSRGFEKFSLAEGHVLQVGKRGLEVTCAVPFAQDYCGSMVLMDSDDLNFCVTPNHDMITDKGTIEAGMMFDRSRSRPQFCIPRTIDSGNPDYPISDSAISLAAAYLCDGSDKPHCSFWIAVSRPGKIQRLEQLQLHHAIHGRTCAGDKAESSSGRVIITRDDKKCFGFKYDLIAPLVAREKKINEAVLLRLSLRQSRIFADSLMVFDGHTNTLTNVHRFYSSNLEIVRAFEIACVMAGYSVSNRKSRHSDIGKTNYSLTASARNHIPVRRWGSTERTGLETIKNATKRVWCVTVPSGVIVVRRNGFSMLCGNCAEADALRSSFPTMLGGLYLKEEVDRERKVETTTPIFSTPAEETATDAEIVTEAPASAPAMPLPLPVPPAHKIPAPVKPVAKPEPLVSKPEPVAKTPLGSLELKMAQKGITEGQMLGFLIGIGNVEDSVESLSQVSAESPDAISMVLEQWSDISERILSL